MKEYKQYRREIRMMKKFLIILLIIFIPILSFAKQPVNSGGNSNKGGQGEKATTSEGIKDAREIQFEGVLKATKKTETSIYAIQDFNNNRNTIGLKFKYYFGKSYAEQVEDKLNKRIDELEKKLTPSKFVQDNMEIVPTENGFKIQKKEK